MQPEEKISGAKQKKPLSGAKTGGKTLTQETT
jgi:hypothetical protein